MSGVRLRTVLLIVMVAAVLTFILQNAESTQVSFLTFKQEAPLALIILGVYLLGMLTGWAVFSFMGRSTRAVVEGKQVESSTN